MRVAVSGSKKLSVSHNRTSEFRVERGTEQHLAVILQMIQGLADYEKLSHEVVATEDIIRNSLFGRHPAAEVVIGYGGSEPIGFAVFFQNFSTFLGRPGLYLEDLFILPEWRNRGFGRKLLAHVASIAVDRGCGRLEWVVLDWNKRALKFYRSLGAQTLDEWTVCRLTGDALERFGSAES